MFQFQMVRFLNGGDLVMAIEIFPTIRKLDTSKLGLDNLEFKW